MVLNKKLMNTRIITTEGNISVQTKYHDSPSFDCQNISLNIINVNLMVALKENHKMTKVMKIHPLGIMAICNRFNGNPLSGCWDIWVWTKHYQPCNRTACEAKNRNKLSSEQHVFMHNFTKLLFGQLARTAVVLPKNLLTKPLLHNGHLWPKQEMSASFTVSYFVAYAETVA